MVQQAAAFVDYYAALDCAPGAKTPDLKRAYFAKLREFHPDHRGDSTTHRGTRMTQMLNEAWEKLQDSDKRASYDRQWLSRMRGRAEPSAAQRTNESKESSAQQADGLRHEGNVFFAQARVLNTNKKDPRSADLYRAALSKYTDASALAPGDHRLWSNRALCWSALGDWIECQKDAQRALELKPDSVKGWLLLAKGMWRGGKPAAALDMVDTALHTWTDNPGLLSLQGEIQACVARDAANKKPCANIEGGGKHGKSEPEPEPDQAQPKPFFFAMPSYNRVRARSNSVRGSTDRSSATQAKSARVRLPDMPTLRRGQVPTRNTSAEPTPPRRTRSFSLPDIGRSAQATLSRHSLPWKGHALCTCDFVKKNVDNDTSAYCAFCLLCNNALAKHDLI